MASQTVSQILEKMAAAAGHLEGPGPPFVPKSGWPAGWPITHLGFLFVLVVVVAFCIWLGALHYYSET